MTPVASTASTRALSAATDVKNGSSGVSRATSIATRSSADCSSTTWMSSTSMARSLSFREGAQQVAGRVAGKLGEAALDQIGGLGVSGDPRAGLVLGDRLAGDEGLAPGVAELRIGAVGDVS